MAEPCVPEASNFVSSAPIISGEPKRHQSVIMVRCSSLVKFVVLSLPKPQVLRMLTPECRPRQLCLDDKKAVWKACNEREGMRYIAMFNLEDGEACY